MIQIIQWVDKDIKRVIKLYCICLRRERKTGDMEDIKKIWIKFLEIKLQCLRCKKNKLDGIKRKLNAMEVKFSELKTEIEIVQYKTKNKRLKKKSKQETSGQDGIAGTHCARLCSQWHQNYN